VYNTDEDHTARDLQPQLPPCVVAEVPQLGTRQRGRRPCATILHEIADDKGLEILDLTVQPDHVHLFVSSPPKHAPSLLANWFKGISSRKYNHRYADHDGEKIGWVRGYYAGTAGHVSSETVKNYTSVTRRTSRDHATRRRWN